ncbi:pentapeptide repeat-containing protein [Psychroserpens sp. AS72]|uniref:pentapeptide repeat-containing protein n=1 Tax=Psychroserpens sp. AS72 TaxID=3135775 RepID=UPI0031769A06
MERAHTNNNFGILIDGYKKDNPYLDTMFTKEFSAPFKYKQQGSVALSTTFENCTFNEDVKIVSDENKHCVLTFVDCIFEKDVIAKDAVMQGKVRFRNCHFKGYVNFRNTTFNALLDLWRCRFEKETIFYKTDFMDIVVLSAVTFNKSVLFTYALIDKLLILRGTKAEAGFDLSLAIISGDLSVFNFRLRAYEAFDVTISAREELKSSKEKTFDEIYEDIYEKAVSEKGVIPIKNQRETYRILKAEFESKKSIAQSLQYKYLEKETFRKELKQKYIEYKKEDSFKKSFAKLKYNVSNFLDRINLKLNKISNSYGISYGKAFAFIIGFGWLFFYFSLIATDSFEFSLNPLEWEFDKGLGYFIQYLIPTHKFDYMGEEVKLTSCFYLFDFFGRTFVGYGIFQFIQAFRKYR